MPKLLGGLEKPRRVKAIAKMISNGKYDLYLLQELWMKSDYNTIKDAIPANYHMTKYKHPGSCFPLLAPPGN